MKKHGVFLLGLLLIAIAVINPFSHADATGPPGKAVIEKQVQSVVDHVVINAVISTDVTGGELTDHQEQTVLVKQSEKLNKPVKTVYEQPSDRWRCSELKDRQNTQYKPPLRL